MSHEIFKLSPMLHLYPKHTHTHTLTLTHPPLMDVSNIFIVKPNPHPHPLSPPFTSCISPIISLRSEFLGREFRRRRKCSLRGLGLGFHSPAIRARRRFAFRTSSSLNPQTVVVVVSFVAVSALTVFYFRNRSSNQLRFHH